MFWGFCAYRSGTDLQDQTATPACVVRLRQFSAPGLLVFVFTVSFAYIDWMLSADADFYSTVYGAMHPDRRRSADLRV